MDDKEEVRLDLRGLICPIPVLRLRKRLKQCAPGTRFRILATDHAAPRDIRALCAAMGAEYLGDGEEDGAYRIDVISALHKKRE